MSSFNAFYGSSSAESLPLPPEKKWRPRGPNHVRVLFLHKNRSMVLMQGTKDGWDLPLFKYKTGIMDGIRSRRVCRDFAKWFGDDLQFVFVVELIGQFEFYEYDNDEPDRLADLKLAVLEHPGHTHIESTTLPEGACWKDSDFVSKLLETMDEKEERMKPLELVLKCIQPGSKFLSSIAEPRHQLGWFYKACSFLECVAKEDGAELQGPIVQEQASFTSTVLVANSSKRRYFLKAPARGSNETQITAKISSLFEEYAPEMVATSSELGCFVTREFALEKLNRKGAMDALGQIHLKSIPYVEELKEAGFVVRDLNSIRDQVKRWAEGYETERVGSIKLFIGQSACYIMYLCRRIGELKIPLTLVHGDFSLSNVGYGHDGEDSERVILFDWEFACISHPFLDFMFHRKHPDANNISEDMIKEYLELWTDYADTGTLREAFKMGTIVGHILRIWSLWDRTSMCEHQYAPSLEEWLIREVNWLDCSLRKVIAADDRYRESPEAKLESEMHIIRW